MIVSVHVCMCVCVCVCVFVVMRDMIYYIHKFQIKTITYDPTFIFCRQSELSKSIPLTEISRENGNNLNTEMTYEKRENTVYEVFVPFGNGPLLLIILGSIIIIAQNLLTNFIHQ